VRITDGHDPSAVTAEGTAEGPETTDSTTARDNQTFQQRAGASDRGARPEVGSSCKLTEGQSKIKRTEAWSPVVPLGGRGPLFTAF
jgi:hypothetical protein